MNRTVYGADTDHGFLEMIHTSHGWGDCRETFKLKGKRIAKWKIKKLLNDDWYAKCKEVVP